MSYAAHNIQIPSGKTTGEVQVLCPQCSHTRQKKNDKCLSVNLSKGTWFCQHCGWKGGLPTDKPFAPKEKEYVRPVWHNRTTLSDKVAQWFEGRGIRQEVLKQMQVSEGPEWMPQFKKEVATIQFNYFRDGELINTKFRGPQKSFKMVKDAELLLYNVDAIQGAETVIICEGEMDALSFIAAGITNVVSVPNGATLGNINLEYLDGAMDALQGKHVILATDNDAPGRNLRDQLAARIGVANCSFVDWGDYKDANDVLVAEGIDGLLNFDKLVRQFPIEGSFRVQDMVKDVADIYMHGLDKGPMSGMDGIDKNLRFVKGYFTVVTGIPSHGKSDFLDQLILKLRWKCAFYTPENKPTPLHITKLARKIIGKGIEGPGRMTTMELDAALNYINEKMFWLMPPDKFDFDTIADMVRQHKQRYDIDCFVIDAWNRLEHNYTDSETKHVNRVLTRLAKLCIETKVHGFLVAHPTKMPRTKDGDAYIAPTLYDISGSANFYNMADNGITIHRDFTNGGTEVIVRKVKFGHWGNAGGVVKFGYDINSGRYYEYDTERFDNWLESEQKEIPLDYGKDTNDSPY